MRSYLLIGFVIIAATMVAGVGYFQDNNSLSSDPHKVAKNQGALKCADIETARDGYRTVLVSDPNLKLISGDATDKYFTDDCHVYVTRQAADAALIQEADPSTFEILGISMVAPVNCKEPECTTFVSVAKDRDHIFLFGHQFDADQNSFELLKTPAGKISMYARDAQHVYALRNSEGTVLTAANPSTFTVTDEVNASDHGLKWVSGVPK